jgi:hypothetical protein
MNSKLYIAILQTYYEVYAIGSTEEEARKNVAKGYRKLYRPEDRNPETKHGTVKELEDFFGIHTYEIDPKVGYTHE